MGLGAFGLLDRDDTLLVDFYPSPRRSAYRHMVVVGRDGRYLLDFWRSPCLRLGLLERFDDQRTALSIPRFRSIGLAPAVTFFRPTPMMDWASTVAVVVPSPASSLVFEATS